MFLYLVGDASLRSTEGYTSVQVVVSEGVVVKFYVVKVLVWG